MLRVSSPSPNFTKRRGTSKPDMVVLHYTATSSASNALNTLCSSKAQVSAHYLISENGCIFNLVDENKRAWHAGLSQWGGISDINSHSIGIELSNDGFSPFGEKLMGSLEILLKEILKKWNIPVHRVLGHSDISPGRKIDPGRKFDWERLSLSGLAIFVESKGILKVDRNKFVSDLKRFGYNVEVPFETLLLSFRLRFNPFVVGPLSKNDVTIANNLALKYPVDVEKNNT